MPIGQGDEIVERRTISIHAVQTLDRNPYPPPATRNTPRADRILNRLGIVVPAFCDLCTPCACTLIGARVGKRIQHHEILALRQC